MDFNLFKYYTNKCAADNYIPSFGVECLYLLEINIADIWGGRGAAYIPIYLAKETDCSYGLKV